MTLQPPSIVTIAPFIVLLISLDRKSSRFAISHSLDVSFLDGCKATTVLGLLTLVGILESMPCDVGDLYLLTPSS